MVEGRQLSAGWARNARRVGGSCRHPCAVVEKPIDDSRHCGIADREAKRRTGKAIEPRHLDGITSDKPPAAVLHVPRERSLIADRRRNDHAPSRRSASRPWRNNGIGEKLNDRRVHVVGLTRYAIEFEHREERRIKLPAPGDLLRRVARRRSALRASNSAARTDGDQRARGEATPPVSQNPPSA